MSAALILFLLAVLQMSMGTNPQQPVNLTWEVLNPVEDRVVRAVSGRQPAGTWFPGITFDLCDLVGRGDAATPRYDHPSSWCSYTSGVAWLRGLEFYVCPGHQRENAGKCGGPESYFCKSWGCETTGSGSWIRDSAEDYIRVTRNSSSACPCQSKLSYSAQDLQCKQTPCNQVILTFTEKGRAAPGWSLGYTWGMMFYQSGTDPGVLFTVRLRQTDPLPQ